MNKEEYLSELNKELKKMPEEERRNAIQYYIEYFDDAGVENSERVIIELGTPKDVANQILSDYAIKMVNAPAVPFSKKSAGKLKWLLIAILVSPIALPVGFFIIFGAVMICGFGIGIILATVAFALVAIAIGVIVTAAGFFYLFSDFATGIAFAGAGLIAVGLGLLLYLVGVSVGKGIVKGVRKGITAIVERRARRNEKTKEIN